MATFNEATYNDDNADPAILSDGTLNFSILPNAPMADGEVECFRELLAPWEAVRCHHAEPGEFPG